MGFTKFGYRCITLKDIYLKLDSIVCWASYITLMLRKLPPPEPPPIYDEYSDHQFQGKELETKEETLTTNESQTLPTTSDPPMIETPNENNNFTKQCSDSKTERVNQTEPNNNNAQNACFKSSEILRSADDVPFETDLVLLFIDSCVTDGMTPSLDYF